MQEFADISQNPPNNMKVGLVTESDLQKWLVTIDAPKESPYAGGQFQLHLNLPTTYPFKPPVINWVTKIYHPNVSNDDKGLMCLGMLRDGEWKPSSKLSTALEYIWQLLITPDVDDAIEQGIAREYKEDNKEFVKKAKKWTKDYAR
ncbi:MAG: hypothetical protein Q9183_004108 [Haloplaca sp. 2 TL-2023]